MNFMYNNIILKLIILTIIILPLQNYYSQMIKSELNLNGNDFNELKIENVGKVFLSKGNLNSIIIERNSDKDEHIDFKIADGIAFIKSTHYIEESKKNDYNIYITFNSEDISINALNIGEFQTRDNVYFRTIKLKIINCRKINLLVDSHSLFFDLQNVFTFKVVGHTDSLTLQKKNVMFSSLRKLNVSTN